MRRPPRVRPLHLLLVGLAVVGCAGSPVLANPPIVRPSPAPATATPSSPPDPLPVVLPHDDAPHHRLTEWWYYTGHLVAADGRRFGFEDVIFRAERGGFPVTWASHLALTDERGDQFLYAQRSEVGPQVDVTGTTGGTGGEFAFSLAGNDPSAMAASPAPVPASPSGGGPWSMSRTAGTDVLAASAAATEVTVGGAVAGAAAGPPFSISLSLADAPAVLHGDAGWIDFGPAGGSYYYSRPRMAARGTVTLDGQAIPVSGSAWFDHQWGDFISVGGGGWDWFAVNLDDRTDLTLSLVRAADGSYPLVYGTIVGPDGSVRHLMAEAFSVGVTGHWTSPRTGAIYPAGWRIAIPSAGLQVTLEPTVAAQELDTRATTGVTYWEGSQHVSAMRDRAEIGGDAYVELTGYAPGES
ncbi:MAG TPA: carotenoid 1,2-hydratase [Candidatus Limnocylindrales bacterium]|nr:carotenoid 1,2-hydratase [Candidatus Limnocylindrales bacterium]